jgi:predicted GH43/DUF377 family glycosyl hydrolase
MTSGEITRIESRVARLGVVLSPLEIPQEMEGVLNPAASRDRLGRLLLYPRAVAKGNISRIALVVVHEEGEERRYERCGFVLEPEAPYELRTATGGYGCEDSRVTFVPDLDRYVMVYTGYGPEGPRVAIAFSEDAHHWERLGLLDFSAKGLHCGDDKDGVMFPEPVISPKGVKSFAFYHRPMLRISAENAQAAVPIIMKMPPADRESMRICYVPYDAVIADGRNLLKVAESVLVLPPGGSWGAIKTGGGTPPVRTPHGWLSVYHGVDVVPRENGTLGYRYSAGLILHELERPHIVRYHSRQPILSPEGAEERLGVVNDVVFPTGIDSLSAEGAYDLYYGMADSRIGRAQLRVTEVVESALSESAA